ncbi:hypothetical protein K458DRAFT_388288 [Lentithecium fluviatile CBS 122367]|uniref:Uncharacterized protein n=1 Tax=Lentithecium fluviatile CBS 122367 TaxID=1168545 RepID=A0A6G1J4S0_9PLEO|nr:hypothetical protein K458DRAFT_388288 [Lentithecium fluviatile CBS 122367]
MVIGLPAHLWKQRSLEVIADVWDSDWFEKILQELRDPRWVRAEYDVHSLNENASDSSDTLKQRRNTLPKSRKDDRHREELVPPVTPGPPPTKLDYSAVGPSKIPIKRKRDSREVAGMEYLVHKRAEKNDSWQVVMNGKEMVRRVDNCIIRKPIEIPSLDSEPSENLAVTQ